MVKLRQVFNDGKFLEIPFETSIFPDQTSQVWKIQLKKPIESNQFQILWIFDSEVELFHVLQLNRLLKFEYDGNVLLEIPYLPYARQDKEINNESTWALHLFSEILKSAQFQEVRTFDQHSAQYFTNQSAQAFHQEVINHDIICFPDKGARTRYPHLYEMPYVFFDKVRNQLTGQIEGLTLSLNGQNISGKSIVIVDDLCDGGGTFVHATRELEKHRPLSVDLCVSHGLFSKGQRVLLDAGIRKIFTTNSLRRNPDGFAVWK